MKRLLQALGALALLGFSALSFGALQLVDSIRDRVAAVNPLDVAAAVDNIRDTTARLDQAADEIRVAITEIRHSADAATALLKASSKTVRAARSVAVQGTKTVRAGQDTLQAVERAVDGLKAQVERIGPALDQYNALAGEAGKTIADVRPFLIGTVASLKVTGGNAAQMAIEAHKAAPETIRSIQGTAENVRQVSKPGLITRILKKLF